MREALQVGSLIYAKVQTNKGFVLGGEGRKEAVASWREIKEAIKRMLCLCTRPRSKANRKLWNLAEKEQFSGRLRNQGSAE
jgi:hypothetical protein